MVKISIIMGVYNTTHEEYLEKAVYSILNQTFTNFEFIICDDGSTDKTFEILTKYAKNDSRIVLFKNDVNKGLAFTLNNCLGKAKGEYIARMDADDESHLDRLERQSKFLDTHFEYGLCGSCINLFNENGIWGKRNYKEIPKAKDFLYRVATPHPTIMARKTAFDIVVKYDESKHTFRVEDYDIFMRMFAKGVKFYNFQDPLYDYREDREGIKKKKACYRLNEVKVRFKGYCLLKLMPIGLIYCIKPLIAIFIPQAIIKHFQKSKKHL